MQHLNNYKPPVPQEIVPQLDDPIDFNFCLPIPTELNSERVKLVPFVPSQHANQLLVAVSDHPELYQYLPYGPFHVDTPESFYKWHEFRIRSDPETLLFAVIDKTKPSPASHPDQGGPMAGVLGYLNTSAVHLATEIGHVLVFPPWQRTFLTTNAVALTIIHGLDISSKGGWGLRRVQWQAFSANAPSIKAAQRMGMKFEGVIKWQRTLPAEAVQGIVVDREGDPRPDAKGRHSAMLAICWDDYDKTVLEKLMERVA